jgi:hypothetical protein
VLGMARRWHGRVRTTWSRLGGNVPARAMGVQDRGGDGARSLDGHGFSTLSVKEAPPWSPVESMWCRSFMTTMPVIQVKL